MSGRISGSPGAATPDAWISEGQLPSGERIGMRLLRVDDAARLGDYFAGLSARTRARYGPHPFDAATARAICTGLDPTEILRLVATVPREGEEQIIAYVLLKLGVLEEDGQRYAERGLPLDPATDCTLAPSVADDYQNRGVGSMMMAHLLPIARRLGRRRVVLWLGVQATNDRAVHFYTKWGFRKVGEFYTDKNNFDMILDLEDRAIPQSGEGERAPRGYPAKGARNTPSKRMGMKISETQTEQFIRDGYLVARSLLPRELVEPVRAELLEAMGIDPDAPATWEGKTLSSDPAVLALTARCRTEAVEAVAEQLAGPHFVRGLCGSPYLESRGVSPVTIRGYIPVLNFPTPGPRKFQSPQGYHIDGMGWTTLWPDHSFLVVFAYLTDVADYGGATTVLPGSHRQVFEHWVRTSHAGSTHPPDLEYAEPVPVAGGAGDVLFLHYLMVHSGSANHSDQIRVGLNTAVMPDPARPYQRRTGLPRPDWTPLDHTLRTDNLP